MVLGQKGPCIKHVSEKSKKCRGLAPVYISLYRGLEYLRKIGYIILVDPLRLRDGLAHIFTKLSQNVSIHTFKYIDNRM